MTMKPLGPAKRHYWLLQDMAKATKIDLVRAFDRGVIDNADWATLVTACRGCDWAGGCQRWLQNGDGAEVPPKPCRNRARLAALKIEQELA